MRILVTGCSGFVGQHFLEYLVDNHIDVEVLGLSREPQRVNSRIEQRLRFTSQTIDLLDRTAVAELLARFRPTHILHLAAYSSVGFSWQNPVESFTNNTNILLSLLEQIRRQNLPCRVLSVGSSEEYGAVNPEMLPLREDSPLNPVSPYAVARVAQEMLSSVYVRGYGLDVVMTRSFNHIGTLQRDQFVVPSLARQLIELRNSSSNRRLMTGDRSIVRDFIDVRDVVAAYFLLFHRGVAGEIYNVCTGRGVSIDWLIERMQQHLGTRFEVELDPTLVRPSDNRAIVGSYDKIADATGWKPHIELENSLAWILDFWAKRARVAAAG